MPEIETGVEILGCCFMTPEGRDIGASRLDCEGYKGDITSKGLRLLANALPLQNGLPSDDVVDEAFVPVVVGRVGTVDCQVDGDDDEVNGIDEDGVEVDDDDTGGVREPSGGCFPSYP